MHMGAPFIVVPTYREMANLPGFTEACGARSRRRASSSSTTRRATARRRGSRRTRATDARSSSSSVRASSGSASPTSPVSAGCASRRNLLGRRADGCRFLA